MKESYFTIERAESALREIEPCLRRAKNLHQQMESICSICDYDSIQMSDYKPQLNKMSEQLQLEIDRIQSLGAFVRDLEIGVVDFPSFFQGKEIFLCWKLGDRGVIAWHDVGETLRQRQNILVLTEESL
jgi:hypothetical protein